MRKDWEEAIKERKKRANKIVDELAAEGRTYSDAASVLRMAADELARRRSDEIVKASQ